MVENKEYPLLIKENIKNIDKNGISVVLIAHVQPPRGHINRLQLQCSETERFSIEEFNEIYQGIVAAGFFIKQVYYNEIDFITDYSEKPNRFHNCLIYSLARNGLRDNKKTIIPAFCELVRIRYTCSPSLACALCRNKYYFTVLLQSHNIPTPRSWLLSEDGCWKNDAPPNGTLVICKPSYESASQGVGPHSVFKASPQLFEKYKGTGCIVQEFIQGEECEVPVIKIGGSIVALSPVGIDLMGRNILDEQASSGYEYGFYSLSQTKSSDIIKMIQGYAEKAFDIMQMDVYGRIDFRIDKSNRPYIIDVSTTPYTTKHSSFAFAFEKMGLAYADIYETVISSALQRE